jgi:DNA recombination protein RmuC
MDTFTIVIIAAALLIIINIVFAILLYQLLQKKPEADTTVKDGIGYLQRELQDVRRSVDTRINEASRDINATVKHQLTESSKIVREVTEGLTKLGETNKQVVGFAEQLKQMQDILKNPKQRGVLGEYYLESVLQNVLPPESFTMQYSFENGEIVDAAVFVKDKVIPVDSKFSLENYTRMVEAREPGERERYEKAFVSDLKQRIVETSKYIRPSEDTTDFAFMFIPHEAIYYDLLVNKVGAGDATSENLIQRAAGKYRVIIVSPTSFLAYLQTVLQGLKAMHIEESAKKIRAQVEDLGRHVAKWEEYYKKLGSTLSTTVSHYNAGYKELGKIDKDVIKIAGSEGAITPLTLEKPQDE